VRVTDVFGPGLLMLKTDYDCGGTEESLDYCENDVRPCVSNESAGVICSESFDNYSRCIDEETTLSLTPDKIERFGECEPYKGGNEMCDSIFRVDLDYVFVLKHHGSQKHVSEILSSAIQMSLKPHSRYCLDGVYRIICNYYLSPCGSALSPSAPRSICPDECSFVQNECFQDWITLEVMLRDHDFVHCEDTKALLFPLPSCCEEVGLVNISSKNEYGAAVGGSVAGTLLLVSALTTVIIFVYVTLKRRRKKLLKLQMDIFATNESRAIPLDIRLRKTEVESNTYSGSDSRYALEGGSGGPHLIRLNSCHLREFARGKFLIKYQHITELENIGQGEFGVVYKARLAPHGECGQIVAIKTLKGILFFTFCHVLSSRIHKCIETLYRKGVAMYRFHT
jgi:hypothetical protein